ncbi:gamma-glutamylcyclotransferase [Anabaena sphaerica FACHB-251]|uniref:Gamma-glutamylcyclotransferase n=1 Tax=Anabaena sphaerica FACHB-251 TaxID=2692883 RepID=A0A926WHM4_9NOST|nr:gamma-glutamylcyclotransferase [Anabaena sphaerica]MBD2293323.1 gamma-glutamylcyclotransferase [Anabaena sphaerica FACHB-251]
MTGENINIPQILRVFVYGTLKPGEANYHLCERQVLRAKKAITSGKLFTLPMGYPAMTLGDGKVHGYLLYFADSAILTALDDLEDYDSTRPTSKNLYNRQSIEIFEPIGLSLGWAWAYLMTPEKVDRFGGIPQMDGCWNS